MTVSDVLMILAVVLAPFFAVYAQRKIDLWRENRERKLRVFKTLMATRAATVSPEHVQALNVIDLEFTHESREERAVRAAWSEYRDHLNSFPREGDDLDGRQKRWHERTPDFLANLLGVMGQCVGYAFDAVQIKKGAYYPEAHGTAELESLVLRRRLVDWLVQNNPVSVSVVPMNEDARQKGEQFVVGVLALLGGSKRIEVELCSGERGTIRVVPGTASGGAGNQVPPVERSAETST